MVRHSTSPSEAGFSAGGSGLHQGFRLGSTLGLQFHLEMTENLIRDWTKRRERFPEEKIGRDTKYFLETSNLFSREWYGNFCI